MADTQNKRWSRDQVAEKMNEFEQAPPRPFSQRWMAKKLGVPRTTLQHWLKRQASINAAPEVVAFFESPAGVALLQRLVLAAHLVMTLLGPCGIRMVCLFLKLSGLDQFVAASYGAQHQVAVAVEEAVVAFGQAEQKRLAAGMAAKQITVCEDETFHPEVCLVAIEPVSNFILLEQYADNRQAQTWTKSLTAATKDLSIEIVQSTSDEGRGILRHVQKDLGVQHSPDLFHIQQELVQGTSIALAGQKRQAEQDLTAVIQQQKEPVSSESTAELAAQLEQAQAALATAAAQQERAQQAIHGISRAYHPYDLETGAARSAAEVASTLEQHFAEIEAVAAETHLPPRCRKKIQKAHRLVVEMVATMAFFWLTVRAKVEALALTPAVERAVYAHLIPAIYLDLVAAKVSDPEQRYALQSQAAELLRPLLSSDGPLRDLETEELIVIEAVARECAQLFQRSSSCVEGRNGLLALRHHSLHRLGNRKLAALTTVHNYFIQRSDGTTAAERFFGARPRDLFQWLLERVDLPGRPAQKRSRLQQRECLLQAAA